MKQEEFNEQFRQRTKLLSLKIIQSISTLRYDDALSILRKQVIRSSTSVAANFRAACRARSQKEKFAKLCIVVEEADETIFWLEMVNEAGYLSDTDLKGLHKEAQEILYVMSAFKKKLQTPPNHNTRDH